jgi:hypothetical protein
MEWGTNGIYTRKKNLPEIINYNKDGSILSKRVDDEWFNY